MRRRPPERGALRHQRHPFCAQGQEEVVGAEAGPGMLEVMILGREVASRRRSPVPAGSA